MRTIAKKTESKITLCSENLFTKQHFTNQYSLEAMGQGERRDIERERERKKKSTCNKTKTGKKCFSIE